MMYICSECGNQIPEEDEFCHQCGCMRDKALVLDDSGNMTFGKCHSCGAEVGRDEAFCHSCGAALVLPMDKLGMGYSPLAMLLAVIPGMFGIFGLGHLALKQWSRGVMFIVMSLIVLYINGWSFNPNGMFTLILSVGLFAYQITDLFRIMYQPEVR